jgi:hypothetical protein
VQRSTVLMNTPLPVMDDARQIVSLTALHLAQRHIEIVRDRVGPVPPMRVQCASLADHMPERIGVLVADVLRHDPRPLQPARASGALKAAWFA